MRRTFVFRAIFTMSLLVGCIATAACSKPKMPDHDDPPEPQAAAQPTQLREATQRPIDKAEAAQAEVDAAAERQRAAIDAATGG